MRLSPFRKGVFYEIYGEIIVGTQDDINVRDVALPRE